MARATNKNRKRLNVIDAIIILLLIALVGTFAYGIYSKVYSKPSSADSKYRVVFECSEEYYYNSILNYLSDGEAVYFAADGVLLGNIYDANPNDEVGAVYEISDDKDDTADQAESVDEEYRKIRFGGELKLNAEAIKSKRAGYYSISDVNITVGSTINVYTDEAEFTLTIVSITAIEQ